MIGPSNIKGKKLDGNKFADKKKPEPTKGFMKRFAEKMKGK